MLEASELLEDYILEHIDAEPSELHRLYRHTHLHHLYPRMCSGHYQGRLLKMLTTMVKPGRILELGTYTGYATLSMAEGMPDDCHLDTVEIDDEKADELTERFASSPYAGRIHLLIGDALDVVSRTNRTWDMVFIDANKRHYGDYLRAVLPKVAIGGYILVDNTLWDMKVVTGNFGHDEQARAIARFNDEVARDERLEKVILPVRDGLTIIRRVR